MGYPPDFKARVQFSFSSSVNDGEDKAAILKAKVAELFYEKKQMGCLNYWLLELAYGAAERELGYKLPYQSSGAVIDVPVKEQEPLEKSDEPMARNGSMPKAAPKMNEQSDSQKFAVQQVAQKPDDVQVQVEVVKEKGEDGWDDDLKDYMPITLTGGAGTKRRIEMPKGMKDLVLDT